jgi:hypothetical protein
VEEVILSTVPDRAGMGGVLLKHERSPVLRLLRTSGVGGSSIEAEKISGLAVRSLAALRVPRNRRGD